jgi:serine/threonine-protein kinase
MGEVWQVHDRVLEREVALKVCLRDAAAAAERFAREARITARLQHPGVLALYDLGHLEDGRPWYTMRLVPHGRTLRAVWAGQPDPRARVRPLLAVASVLACAHRLGIRHLDVKLDNVLLGSFGEVLLLDWGVAQDGEQRPGVAGTPGYAAPEQAQAPTTRCDVYALGVLLYEAVVGHRFVERSHGPVPESLERLWHRCLAEPETRPPAEEVAVELESWLDDVARRQRAEAHVAQADALAPRVDELRAEAARLRGDAGAALSALPRLAPAEAKSEAWDAEERADRLVEEAVAIEASWEGALTAALAEADLPEARERLAERFLAHLDATPTAPEARRWEQGVRTFGSASHLGRLDAPGVLTLFADPPARVRAYRLVTERRRRVPVFAWEGVTPLVEVPLAPGRWLLELDAPGFSVTRYPVFVARGQHWDGVPPGATDPRPIRLPAQGELGPDDVYVPAGWAMMGGDPFATDPVPSGRRWVDGFVIRRFPVTAGEYVDWLHTLVERGDEAAVTRFQPQDRFGPSEPWRAVWERDSNGRFQFTRDAVGNQWRADLPVTLIDLACAEAFMPEGWRLPRGIEVEKAARGVDGRLWPWGDGFEPMWACTAESHTGPVVIQPVTAFPMDESLYGVRGLAGNARTWCAHAWNRDGGEREGALREVRGGAYGATPALCRVAGRLSAPPDRRLNALGLRLCRPWA